MADVSDVELPQVGCVTLTSPVTAAVQGEFHVDGDPEADTQPHVNCK